MRQIEGKVGAGELRVMVRQDNTRPGEVRLEVRWGATERTRERERESTSQPSKTEDKRPGFRTQTHEAKKSEDHKSQSHPKSKSVTEDRDKKYAPSKQALARLPLPAPFLPSRVNSPHLLLARRLCVSPFPFPFPFPGGGNSAMRGELRLELGVFLRELVDEGWQGDEGRCEFD